MTMKNVEDIYPLSPLQQGILYHTLHEESFSMYFEIITWVIEGEINLAAYEQAWQRTVNRHPVLRSSFLWEGDGVDEPLQVVRRRVKLPMAHLDWRELSAAQQEESLSRLFEAERARGFNLAKPPLMRVTLIRTGESAYRFVWCYHHSLVDGWSCSLIFNDVFVYYETLCKGVEAQLPPAPMFCDYINWVRRQDLSKAEAYWRRTLQGFAGAKRLDIESGAHRDESSAHHDAPLGDEQTRSYREQFRTRPASVTAALKHLAREHQLTLNTICLGAWAVLLHHYSDEQDIVCGVAVSGRPPQLTRVEDMVGMLVNTLPARIKVQPASSLIPWLKEIQRGQVEMREYEYSALVQVQGWSDVLRSNPLFETVLSFENHPIDFSLLKRNDRAELRDAVHLHTATGIPINLIIEPGEELGFKILYDFNRFDDDTIRRMLDHLSRVLESIAARPSQRLLELSPLDAAERAQLLVEWNEVPRVEPREEFLHEMFEAQAAAMPDRVALVAERERLTYIELNGEANRLAHHLRALGVGPEVTVAVSIGRSAGMVTALLAVLKAGGAYVPLDPTYPPERLAFMLEDAQVSVLLTERRWLEMLPPHVVARLKVVCLDTDRETWADESESNLLPQRATAANLAYVIYTSGSTGRPKGVAIEHRSAVVLLLWALATFDQEQLAGVLASTSISFDLSVFEFFAPLSCGGKVILADDALHLPSLDAASEVTLVNTVPSAMTELVRMGALPTSVRTVNLAGEPLPARLARQLYEHRHVEKVYNLYGPSEDTTYSTYSLVERDGDGPPSIGRPVANTQVYLLDRQLRPVPIGVAGELYLGGSGLARGYLKRAELTAERFIPDAFGGEAGARLYRTGDLARYSADGELRFLGRIDTQVKIRGFRIELGEIESVIESYPPVRACHVAARADASGEQRLVAYVVAQPDRATPLPLKLDGDARARLLADRQHLRVPNGMLVAGHSSLQTSGIYHEIFEDLVYLKHGIELPDDACVFDVGANIGLFTLFVKQQAHSARVYSFEPLPPNFDVLRTNVALYGLDVNLFQCGMASKPNTAEFTFYPHAAAMSRIGSHVEEDKLATRANVRSWLERSGPAGEAAYGLDEFVDHYLQSETYNCPLTTLSDVIREHRIECIDLLKLDVEKSELDVLAGIEDEDWPKIRQMVVEVHTDELLARIMTLLRERGFTFAVDKSTLVEEQGQDIVRVYMLYARRPAPEADADDAGRQPKESNARASDAFSVKGLRDFLREKLPEYMLPSFFVMLDALPLTPNGKIDRAALPAPGQLEAETPTDYVAPRNPVEEIVADICASVLQLERVGIFANFFELGGHSLLAAQVISRVRETFKVELSLRKLFLKPTVEGLAENVETALRAGDVVSVVPLESVPRTEDLPLSFSQRRLWFLDQLEPGCPRYNLTHALRLKGRLDLESLERSINEIVRRHEILRTTFKVIGRRPVQVISAAASIRPLLRDVSHLPEAEREAEAERLVTEQSQHRFDLAQGPLLLVTLVRISDEEHIAAATMHHIISDGWSLGVWVRELATLYRSFSGGLPSPLAELPIQYADFAAWEHKRQQSEEQRHLAYWREQLGDNPPALELPFDHARPSHPTFQGASLSTNITPELTHELRKLSHEEGCTLFMTLLAAFKSLLHVYSTQTDIVVGTDVANRNSVETEGLIGFFVNMLVLRTDLSGDPTFRELLKRVRETALAAYTHQDMPFDALINALRVAPERNRNPLFQTVFVLQNVPLQTLALPGLTLANFDFQYRSAPLDLVYALHETVDGLVGTVLYSTELFERATIERMVNDYRILLESIAADPDQRLSDIHVPGKQDAVGYTLPDFPDVKLNQQQLASLLLKIDEP